MSLLVVGSLSVIILPDWNVPVPAFWSKPSINNMPTTYGTYSSGPYSGTYSATTYDAGRAYAAQSINNAETAENFAAIQARGQQRLGELQNTILKDNTVLPGEWIGGIVVLDRPDKGADGIARYQIDVRFGDEVHSFAVNQACEPQSSEAISHNELERGRGRCERRRVVRNYYDDHQREGKRGLPDHPQQWSAL
jgi:hypothetical protein